VAQSDAMPHKQRYTAARIYQLVREEGYRGSEVSVRRYVRQLREKKRRPQAYLPLELDPGFDGQADRGEA